MVSGIKGFTLVELMIVVAIIGVLAMIAYPSYQGSVLKGNRSEAISKLTEMRVLQEKWRANNTTYGTLANIGVNANGTYYTFSVENITATTFTAKAVATGTQANDTGCTTLTLDQNGTRGTDATCFQ